MALLAVSCEKVIDIDLPASQSAIVIQGNLPLDSACRILISKSIIFNQLNVFPIVSGALVTISDDQGNSETCTEIDPPSGRYESGSLLGVEGRTYTLTVEYAGHTYVAASSLPQMVPLDSLGTQTMGIMGAQIFQVIPYFTDPVGIPNWYKFETALNGVSDTDIRLRNDAYTDGQLNLQPINLRDAKSGDLLTFTMLGIDQAAFFFYNTLRQSSSSMTTPANPTTNFSGGCLGYFKAYNSQTMKMTLP